MNSRPVFFRISRNRKKAASAPSMRPKALSGSIAKYSRGLALSALTLIGAPAVSQAATYYWNTGTATWAGSTWSDNATSGGTTGVLPGVNDTITFNQSSVNGAETVSLGVADRSVLGITFSNTGTTLLQGGGTNRILTIGTSGITINSGAGAVTIGSVTNGQNVAITLNGNQSWTNNSSSLLTIHNNVSGTGSPTLTNNGTGSGSVSIAGTLGSSVTKVVQDSATSNLLLRNGVGLNAFGSLEVKKGTVEFGNGATNGAANLGAGTVTLGDSAGGNNAATLFTRDNSNVSFANPIVLAANTTGLLTIRLGEDAVGAVHSKTFTGGITGNNSLTIENNGGTGNGPDTINFTTNQLNFTGSLTHIGTGNGASTISSVIGSSVTGVTQNSASSVLILGNANTYSGTTKANAGVLRLNNLSALQNSALDTSGAGTVDANAGTGNYVFGGLISGTNLATVITNDALITTLTLNPQSGSVTYNNAIANLGASMALIKSGAGTQVLGGTNTYRGNTLVSVGTLQFAKQVSLYNNGAAATWNSTNINVNSGATMAFNIGGSGEFTNANIVSLLGLATATTNGFNTGAILGLDTTSGDVLFNSVIANPKSGTNVLGLTKLGTNKLTLDRANTYTGNTLVSVGTLQFAKQVSLYNNGAAATWSKTNINVNSGATMAFNIGGTGEFTNANIVSLLGLADATTNGFKTGAILGLDTTSGDVLFNSVIANPNSGTNVLGLTKLGTNKLTLDQANTYTGVTTVSNGTLTLNRTAADNTTILTDTNTATTSDIVINGGTLELAASEQIRNTGSINMSSGAFNFGAATGRTETIDKFTNSGGTFSTGANILIGLGNTITWSGGTNTVNNGGAVQDLHIVISGGTNTVEGGATGGVLQLNSGGLGLEMSAGSTLTLNSDNAVAGKLLLKGDVSSSGDSTVTIASGLALTNKGNIDLDNGTRTFTVANGTADTDMSISAVITNTGSIIKDGAGTLSLDAANTYSGTTAINNGTLIANVLGALPLTPRSAVSFTGGGNPALSLGANQVAASLTSVGATTGTVTLGSNTLTVGAGSGSTDFKGSIGGAGNLIKDDASTQVLSGTNAYTGTTTVSGGTLEVQGSLSGTTGVTVNTGGTLLMNSAASNIVNTTATVAMAGGTLAFGNAANQTQNLGALTLTANSTLDFGAGGGNDKFHFAGFVNTAGTLAITNWLGNDAGGTDGAHDRLVFTGLFTDFTSSFSQAQISFNGTSGYAAINFGGTYEIVPVPEPATTALIGSIALCALVGYRERRRFTRFGKRIAARK
jgi:autotransporter-associated beta strand protein